MKKQYIRVRKGTEDICVGLKEHELSLQPRGEVSPAKWHLGHTTWFFEKIILEKYLEHFQCFNPDYDFVFNSYYKQLGKHLNQQDRGEISIESTEVLKYRKYVDQNMLALLESENSKEIIDLVTIGLNHEEQHQELLHMDIKAALFFENKHYQLDLAPIKNEDSQWFEVSEGLISCGNQSNEFSYDNERPRHQRYQNNAFISKKLVTKSEYREFINSGAYSNPLLWLSKGWEWLCENKITAPLYWDDNKNDLLPVSHISYFEADAFANYMGCRLPTEFEHEIMDQDCKQSSSLWSWTSSSYGAYPGFVKFDGALSEYNGKFMCNQYILRGGCVATPRGHWRPTYRNFYEPHQRWMFSGIRLAKDK